MTNTKLDTKNVSKQITKLWLSGDGYSTCIIPKPMAVEYGLSEACYITIEKAVSGLLIKKLNFKEGDS